MKSVAETLHAIAEKYKDKPRPTPVPEPPPACSECNDHGWYTEDVEVSDPMFGQIVYCECQSESWKQRQKEKLRAFAGLPVGLETCTFEDMAWHPPNLTDRQATRFKRVANYCRDYALGTVDERWLLLAGSIGWGKSHLAACIVNKRLERNEIAKFLDFPSVLQELRAGFDDNSYGAILESYKSVPLLVLDDVGAEYQKANEGMSWSQEQLYLILNHRYANRMETIITTNVMPSKLDARIADRMQDVGTGLAKVLHEDLPSFRLKA